jgi:hypothetical protein
MTSSDVPVSTLDVLWQRFGHIARARVDTVRDALLLLHAQDPGAQAACGIARGECHKLVGSLDSYGRVGGSALAARAEDLLAQLEAAGAADGPLGDLAVVLVQLDALLSAAPAAAGAEPCVCPRCGAAHHPPGP